jgi:tetratricopeptide (TPR) repeat protein
MVRKLFLIILVLLISLTCPAQVKKQIDSLRNFIDHTSNDTLKIKNWNLISMLNSNRGYYIMGEKAAYEALAIAKKMNYDRGIAKSYYQIGISFSKRNKYDVALEWYAKAIPLYEKAKDTSGLAYTVMLIGVIDYYLKNYSKAEEHYKKALELFKKEKNDLGMANCMVNLGSVYYAVGDYDKALAYCQDAYDHFGASVHGKAVASNIIANVNSELYTKNDSLGNTELARKYLEKAISNYNNNLKIYSQLDLPVEKGGTYLDLFGITFKAGQYAVAKQYIDSSYALIKDINNIEGLKFAYQAYYRWYLQRKDSSAALRYYLLFSAAKDSVFNMEKAEKMDALNVQLMEVEKEKEISVLKQQQEKRGLILWGLGALAILALGFSFLFFKRYREKKEANTALSEKNRIIEEKQKEITDSIYYARRIQSALLASEKYFERTLERLRKKS